MKGEEFMEYKNIKELLIRVDERVNQIHQTLHQNGLIKKVNELEKEMAETKTQVKMQSGWISAIISGFINAIFFIIKGR